jgi:hypothetical protein
MIVNSSNGPLNCNEYDSALLTIDRNEPAAGSELGLIHASSEIELAGDSTPFDGMLTLWFVPLNVTAVFASLVSRPAVPSVGEFWYEPELEPTPSNAVVPEVSPRRQYAPGASPTTAVA